MQTRKAHTWVGEEDVQYLARRSCCVVLRRQRAREGVNCMHSPRNRRKISLDSGGADSRRVQRVSAHCSEKARRREARECQRLRQDRMQRREPQQSCTGRNRRVERSKRPMRKGTNKKSGVERIAAEETGATTVAPVCTQCALSHSEEGGWLQPRSYICLRPPRRERIRT